MRHQPGDVVSSLFFFPFPKYVCLSKTPVKYRVVSHKATPQPFSHRRHSVIAQQNRPFICILRFSTTLNTRIQYFEGRNAKILYYTYTHKRYGTAYDMVFLVILRLFNTFYTIAIRE